MARIRSVKPEFWSHPVLGRLNDAAKLLAIALLNYADDEGYFLGDPALVRNFARPFDSDSRSTTVALHDLSRAGFIDVRCHPTHGWIGRVVQFAKHQVINKATKSKLSQYFSEDSGSTPVALPDDSRPEWSREQGAGSRDTEQGSLPATPRENLRALVPASPAAPPAKGEATEKQEGITTATWRAYSAAYAKRYGAEPPRSSQTGGLLKQFLQRIPVENGPAVAAFYVLSCNDSFYIRKKHPLTVLLDDAAKLHTEWQTNRPGTETEARLQDRTAANVSGWSKMLKGDGNGVG